MIQLILIICAVIVSIVMQVLDDFLSQRGIVSVLHGGVLGYGQVYFSKELLEWGGSTLGWAVVICIMAGSMSVSYFKVMNTWTRWVCAFNLGVILGVLYGGFNLI